MSAETIYIGATHDVTYDGATLAADGTAQTAGVCTWELFQADRTTSLATGNLPASGNDYAGTIPAATTAGLQQGRQYWVKIAFAQGGNADVRWVQCQADYRE